MEQNSINKPRSFSSIFKMFSQSNRTKTVEPPKPTFNDYIPMDDYNNTSFENSKTKINTKVTMCCVTWNMHGLKPTIGNIKTLLDKHNNFDIYAIGSEECLNSIAKSTLFKDDKTEWENMLKNYFGNNFYKLDSKTLNAIHLIIFVRAIYKSKINKIGNDSKKTGWRGVCGNKGGVGVWFNLFDVSFLVINSHLAAGFSKAEKRNNDFVTIFNDIYSKAGYSHFVVFMGDLNYRLTLNIKQVKGFLSTDKNFLSLLEFDQLKDAKQFDKCIATNFKEGKIEFNPTFKFNDGTCDYNMNSDDHVPSWTDRILYRKQPGTNTVFDVVLNEYNSQPDVLISDHKPVYAYFTFTIEHEL